MVAKLRIKSTSGGVAPWEVPIVGSLTSIGRGAACAVVLPDPEKHLSRHHVTIESQGDALTLVVESRVNPVLLGGRELGFQQRAPMSNGDVITLADYQMTVVIEAGAAMGNTAPTGDDPFAWLGGSSTASGPVGNDPLADLSRPPIRPPEAPDPFLQIPSAASRDSRLVQGLSAVDGGQQTGFGGFASPSSDPLKIMGGAGTAATAPTARPAGTSSSIDDWLGGIGPSSGNRSGGLVDFGKPHPMGSTSADHVHDVDLPFLAPTPQPVQPSISIPQPRSAATPPVAPRPPADDPFADLLGDLVPPASATPAAPSPPPAPVADPFADFPDLSPAAPPVAPAPMPPTPVAPAPVAAAPVPPVAIPTPASASVAPLPAPVAAPAASVDAGAMLAPFFKGLGLQNVPVPAEHAAAYMELSGQITRAAIAGIVQLLVSRGEMKKELRADDRTMLAAANNNPLKMMVSEEEALGYLFDLREQGGAFMPPLQAVSDACQDIVAHEFGLVAGLRAAVLGALKRCDPQGLEKQADKQGKVGGLLGNRKAQMWDFFLEWYAKTEEMAADDVDRLFERDFLSAYTKQVRAIRGK